MISYRKYPILFISKHSGFNLHAMKLGASSYTFGRNFKELKTEFFGMWDIFQYRDIGEGDLLVNSDDTGGQFAFGLSQLD